MTWAELNEVRSLNRRILEKEKLIDGLKLSVTLQTSVINGMPKSRLIDSRIERLVSRITDAEKELSELKVAHQEAVKRVEGKIKAEIDDATARAIFTLRYVDGMHFRDIGFAIGYSEAHVYYLHRITGEKIVSDWF